MLQLPVFERRESPSCELSGLQTRGGDAEEEVTENNQDHNAKGVLLEPHHPRCAFTAVLRGITEEQQRPQTHQLAVAGPSTMKPKVPVLLY
jgi:hypothetical protein